MKSYCNRLVFLLSLVVLAASSWTALAKDGECAVLANVPCSISDGYDETLSFSTSSTLGGYYCTKYAGNFDFTVVSAGSGMTAQDKEGHVFKGWFTTTSGSGDDPSVDDATVQIESKKAIAWSTIASKAQKCYNGLYPFVLAKYVPRYTITVAASPSGVATVSGGGTYEEGASVTLSVSNVSKGYVVSYWQEGSSKIADSEGKSSITITVSKSATYTAVLTGLEYSLTICPNGGKYDGKTIDQTLSEKLCVGGKAWNAIGVATRAGFSLLGYYTSSSGGVQVYDADGHCAKGDYWTAAYPDGTFCGSGDLRVYACWDANGYTLSFDNQGGEGGPDPVEVTFGESLPQITVPNKIGYKFNGYFTGAEGKGTQYYNAIGKGAVSKWDLDSDTTLYADWVAETYTVKFNNDGATSSPDPVTVMFGVTPDPLNTIPAKAYNTFDGYKYEGKLLWDAQGKWTAGAWDIPSNIVANAVWSPIKYTVKFDANGGAGTGYEARNVAIDEEFELPNGAQLSKLEYTFSGWALDGSASEAKYPGGTKTTIRADEGSMSGDNVLTYYAVWRDMKRMVKFHADPRAVLSTNELQKVAGGKYGELAMVSWPGDWCGFAGWWTAVDGGEQATEDSIVPEDVSIDLYAHWITNSYFIAFDGCGAETGEMAVQEFKFYAPQCLQPNAYEKIGCEFQGWATGASAEVVLADGAEVTNLLARCKDETNTLFAVWKGYPYVVQFFGNGGTNTMQGQSFEYGVAQGLASNAFVRTGFTFDGWATDPTNDVMYGDGVAVSNLTTTADGCVPLFAKWTKIGPSVTELSVAADCDKDAEDRVALLLTNKNDQVWSIETYQSGEERVGRNEKYLKVVGDQYFGLKTFSSAMIEGGGVFAFCYKMELNQQDGNTFKVKPFGPEVSAAGAEFFDSTKTTNVGNWVECVWTNKYQGCICICFDFSSVGLENGSYVCVDNIRWLPDERPTTVVGVTLRRNDGTVPPGDIVACLSCESGTAIGELPTLEDCEAGRFVGWVTESGNSVTTSWLVPAVDVQLSAKWDDGSRPDPTPADRREISGMAWTEGGLAFAFTNADEKWTYVLHGSDAVTNAMPWAEVFSTNGASGDVSFEIPKQADKPAMFYYLETR